MMRSASWCLLAMAVVGCGGGGGARTLPTEPVSGTVTYNGSPVSGAIVVFAPVQSGKDVFSAQAMTDDSGKYTLITSFGPTTESSGAVAGDYIVTIVKAKEAAPVSTGGSPNPQDIAARMGSANKDRKPESSAPRMGPMGRPASASAPTGLKQEESAIPVQYATTTTSPLKVKVPGGSYDFALTDKK